MKVYLASPFFNDQELKYYNLVLDILQKKELEVYAPLLNQINRDNLSRQQWANITFNNDINAIKDSDVVVMLFYGAYSDSGTAWECGYCYGLSKKVIAVHLHEDNSNCMINCSCHANLNGLQQLINYDFIKLPSINYYINKSKL